MRKYVVIFSSIIGILNAAENPVPDEMKITTKFIGTHVSSTFNKGNCDHHLSHAGEVPEIGRNAGRSENGHQGNMIFVEEKSKGPQLNNKALFEFKKPNLLQLFYPNRRLNIPLPLGGFMSFPVLRGSIIGTLGVGALAIIQSPLSYLVGIPLIGLGGATHFVPLRKSIMGKVAMGTSIGGVTLFLTTVFVVVSMPEFIGEIYK